mmetsp:Transcript_14054/g.34127  ORF Transcript_14054/g.34127 Transcript_14054/m.34127 type:complete len:305 (-) Transcript_14054:409-1323(-)
MQVRNTFLHFDEEQEGDLGASRRASSIPPAARLSPTISYAEPEQGPTRSPSPVRSEPEFPSDYDNLPALVQRLVDRPATQGVTTIMVRNVPNKYTQRLLLRVWKQMGYGCAIDLFYLPMDFRNKCNLGYCFLNFVSAEYAVKFRAEVEGMRLTTFKTPKVLVTAEAHIQGFLPNFTAFRNSAVMGKSVAPEYQPLVCDPATGKEVTIPRPTSGPKPAPVPSVDVLSKRLSATVSTLLTDDVSHLVVAGLLQGYAPSGHLRDLASIVASMEADVAVRQHVVNHCIQQLVAAGSIPAWSAVPIAVP